MRTAVLAFLLAVALVPYQAVAGSSEGARVSSAQSARLADDTVLKHSASILGIPISQLRVDRSYASQVVAGDALDIVEIVMAIEDDLNIAIDDATLDASVGASGVEDIAQRLTIDKLQKVVRSILARRPNRSLQRTASPSAELQRWAS